jgi:hypothetical protein
MQNVRRYLYNTATANYPADSQKHQRHPSVSSDNFSSSRSDSWRVQVQHINMKNLSQYIFVWFYRIAVGFLYVYWNQDAEIHGQ